MISIKRLLFKDCINIGTWEEFEEEERFFKENHPIKWKIYNAVCSVDDFLGDIRRKYLEFKWKIFYRFHPKYRYYVVKTGLKPGYYSPDQQMLHASFNLFVRFYKDNRETYMFNDEVKNEMDELYHWWTEERPKRDDLMPTPPEFPEEWGSAPMFCSKYDNTPEVKAWHKYCDAIWEADLFYEQEDTFMLKKLVDIRSSLVD